MGRSHEKCLMRSRKMTLRFVYRVIRRRIPLFASAFALLFTIIACVQFWVIRHAVYKSAEQQAGLWADQVAEQLAYKDKWELKEYRRSSDIQAPSVYVFTADGTVIET